MLLMNNAVANNVVMETIEIVLFQDVTSTVMI